jgi:toxoflavin synthase
MTAVTDQYQSISASYAEARKAPATLYLEEPSVVAALGSLAGQSAIDYACGGGYYTRLLKRLGAARVLGVDLSPQMIAVARAEEAASPLGVDYAVGDGAKPERFGDFDLATAVFLFNYADDAATLAAMFANVAANLADGGRLVAVVPNPEFKNGLKDTLPYEFYLEEIARRPDNLRARMFFTGAAPFSIDFTQWSRRAYEETLRGCGFEAISWTQFSVSPEGIEKFGRDFWRAALENPKSVVLSARKTAG